MIFVVEGRDGTLEKLQHLAAKDPSIRILYEQEPQGLGRAFRSGFDAVARDADWVVTLDADLNHQPEEIPHLLEVAQREDADVVVGSRFLSTSRVEGSPLWKRLLSVGANLLMRLLYGIRVRDKTSGFRVYRASALRRNPFQDNGFAFLPELLLRLHADGSHIVETPIHFVFRRQGDSKLPFWPTTRSYLRLFLRRLGNPVPAEEPTPTEPVPEADHVAHPARDMDAR